MERTLHPSCGVSVALARHKVGRVTPLAGQLRFLLSTAETPGLKLGMQRLPSLHQILKAFLPLLLLSGSGAEVS